MRRIIVVLLALVMATAVGCSANGNDNNNGNNDVPTQAYVSGEFHDLDSPLAVAAVFEEMEYEYSIDYPDRDEFFGGNFTYLGEDVIDGIDVTHFTLEYPDQDEAWDFWVSEEGNILQAWLNEDDVTGQEFVQERYQDFIAPFEMAGQWIGHLTNVTTYVNAEWSLSDRRTVLRDLGTGSRNVDSFRFTDPDGNSFYFEVLRMEGYNMFIRVEVSLNGVVYNYRTERLILR